MKSINLITFCASFIFFISTFYFPYDTLTKDKIISKLPLIECISCITGIKSKENTGDIIPNQDKNIYLNLLNLYNENKQSDNIYKDNTYKNENNKGNKINEITDNNNNNNSKEVDSIKNTNMEYDNVFNYINQEDDIKSKNLENKSENNLKNNRTNYSINPEYMKKENKMNEEILSILNHKQNNNRQDIDIFQPNDQNVLLADKISEISEIDKSN